MFRRIYLRAMIFLFLIGTSTHGFAQDSSQVKTRHNRTGDSIDSVKSEEELNKLDLFVNGDSMNVAFEIELKDGSEFLGKIIEEKREKYVFITAHGSKMDIPKNMIVQANTIEGKWENGEFMRSDPNKTRLLFAPTARSLKENKVYIAFYELYFSFIAVGFTDDIILSGGMSLYPGSSHQIYYIAPKIKLFSDEDLDLAGGILYAKLTEHSYGIAYGVITIGDSFTAFTGGLGFGFENGGFSNLPTLMFGGEVQVSDNVKLISENWFFPTSEAPLFSFGLRLFGANLAADFALGIVPGKNRLFPLLPWFGIAYNF